MVEERLGLPPPLNSQRSPGGLWHPDTPDMTHAFSLLGRILKVPSSKRLATQPQEGRGGEGIAVDKLWAFVCSLAWKWFILQPGSNQVLTGPKGQWSWEKLTGLQAARNEETVQNEHLPERHLIKSALWLPRLLPRPEELYGKCWFLRKGRVLRRDPRLYGGSSLNCPAGV